MTDKQGKKSYRWKK